MSKVEIIEKDVAYRKLNGRHAKYDIYDVDGTTITVDNNEETWEEKYRPRRVSDLIISKDLAEKFNSWIAEFKIPDLLLYSRPGGLGKTSIAQVLVAELEMDMLSIPCNIKRGLDVIKTDVTTFSQNKSSMGEKKIVSFEEIGDMTTTAVDALKSIKDKYSTNVSMIITTNSLSNISGPLKTRLYTIDFNTVAKEDEKFLLAKQAKRIMAILAIEGVEYSNEDLQYLLKKYKYSYRELIQQCNGSVVNGKLKIDRFADDSVDYKEILSFINNQDMESLAKISNKVNHVVLFNYLSENYLSLLTDKNMIMNMIMNLHKYQEYLDKNLINQGIAFLEVCRLMFVAKIKFKV